MTKSEIFKSAHAIAKSTVFKVGNYMIAFKIALLSVYQELKAAPKSTEEKLLELGAEIWENYGHRRIYMNLDLIRDVFGFRVTFYNTGNISGVDRVNADGEREDYSNRKGTSMALNLLDAFYDLNKKAWNIKGSRCSVESESYVSSYLVI